MGSTAKELQGEQDGGCTHRQLENWAGLNKADGDEQQQPKPWADYLYWETGRMEIAQNRREIVLFL